jgi:hypothetical protein
MFALYVLECLACCGLALALAVCCYLLVFFLKDEVKIILWHNHISRF